MAKLPTFENPTRLAYEVDTEYNPFDPPGQKYDVANPLGFTKTVLPHPPNAGRKNPVYELTNLNQRQIEIKVRVIDFLYFLV